MKNFNLTTVKKTIRVNMEYQDLLDGCTEMVTNNGRPFCAVDDSGFRKIINPLLIQFGPGKFTCTFYVFFFIPNTYQN